MTVSGAAERKKNNPHHYSYLVSEPKSEELSESISLDLYRTFPNNVKFNSSESKLLKSLSNILGAFALHNNRIGYCQVSAFNKLYIKRLTL